MTSKDKMFYVLAVAFASAVTYASLLHHGHLCDRWRVLLGQHLVRPSETANAWARAGSDCAALFGTLVLSSGPLWHKTAGGVYWLWDLQLTTSLLSDLVYWALCLLRAFAGEGATERRFAAALGVMGTINLPIIYYSVQNWGSNLPSVIREGGGINPSMETALLWAAISMTVLLPSLLLWLRSRLHLLQASLEHTRQEALARGLVEGSDDLAPPEEAQHGTSSLPGLPASGKI